LKITTKIMLLITVSVVFAALVIFVFSWLQLTKAGKIAIAQIESLGAEDIQRIKSDAKRQEEAYRMDLLGPGGSQKGDARGAKGECN